MVIMLLKKRAKSLIVRVTAFPAVDRIHDGPALPAQPSSVILQPARFCRFCCHGLRLTLAAHLRIKVIEVRRGQDQKSY